MRLESSHCQAHNVHCVNSVTHKNLIFPIISCLKVDEWELIHAYGQEVIFSTYSFIKMELEQESGEKQFQEEKSQVCVMCHTPVRYEILVAGKTRAGQNHLFPEQEVTFHCLRVTPSCSTCCPALYVLRLLCDLNQLWKYS